MTSTRFGPRPDETIPAYCVDCKLDVADDLVFRVLRIDRAGQRHVVCSPCSDARHAATKPSPLQVQTKPPAHLRDRGSHSH